MAQSTDTVSLSIRVESLAADVAEQRLKKLAQTGGTAEKSANSLSASYSKMENPLKRVSTLTDLQNTSLAAGAVSAARYAAQVDEVAQEAAQAETAVGSLTYSVRDAVTVTNLMEETLDSTGVSLSRATVRLSGMGGELKDATSSTATFANVVKSSVSPIDSLEQAVTELRAGAITADNTIEDLREELSRLSKQVKQTDTDTDGLHKNMKSGGGVIGLLRGNIVSLVATYVGLGTAVASVKKLMKEQTEFDSMIGRLNTATGSAENAQLAFDHLSDFAGDLPITLESATDAFTKLVNLGLDPSEAAITSYGNTAAGMGKSLDQLIEAVADAATGEFERLKEFGIKAKSQGADVEFTFRGVTTTVKKNAEEISGYLKDLGDNEFAGVMARKMGSLGVATQKMQEQWDTLWTEISRQGAGELIAIGINKGTEALSGLTSAVSSGQIEAYLDIIGDRFDLFGENTGGVFGQVTDIIVSGAKINSHAFSLMVDNVIGFIAELPENVKYWMQRVGIEVSSLVDYAIITGDAFVKTLSAKFEQLVDSAGVYGSAIGAAINPFADDYDFDAEIKKVQSSYITSSAAISKQAEATIGATKLQRIANIDAIENERQASLDSFYAQIDAANDLRVVYDKQVEARKADKADFLGQFKIDPPTKEGGDSPAGATGAGAKDTGAADLERVVNNLRTEEEAIENSYAQRNKIIEANTKAGSDKQAELLKRSTAEYKAELQEIADAKTDAIAKANEADKRASDKSIAEAKKVVAEREKLINDGIKAQAKRDSDAAKQAKQRASQLEALVSSLATEKEAINKSYQDRNADILRLTEKGTAEQNQLLQRSNADYTDDLAKLAASEQRVIDQRVKAAQALADKKAKLVADAQKETDKQRKAEQDLANKQASDLASVVATLATNNEKIVKSYNDRNTEILRLTTKGSEEQAELLDRSASAYQEQLSKLGQADRDALAAKQKANNDAFTTLTESLQTEEQAVHASYAKRVELLLANTEAGSAAQTNLMDKLSEELIASLNLGIDEEKLSFKTKLENLEEYYTLQRELILDNTALTEEARTELELRLTEERMEKTKELEDARIAQTINATETIYNGLTEIVGNFAGEQSDTYKRLFAVSKAFAIAESIIKIQQGIASAVSLGFPANIPAIAATVAAGASVVSNIQAADFAGAFDHGGFIPAGKTGIVGERGMEFVDGPATVTSREKTANMLQNAQGGGQVYVNIENQIAGADFEVQQLGENEVRIIARKVAAEDFGKNASSNFSNPNSKASKAITNNWKTARKV